MRANYQDISIKFKGKTPFIPHNDILCDPLHPKTKQFKEITSVRKKTDDHYCAMARLEWEASFYFNEELGFYISTKALFSCIQGAAKKSRKGKDVINAVSFENYIGYPINELKGKSIKDLWEATNEDSGEKSFVFTESVVVSRARIMRTRPIIENWSVDFDVRLDTEVTPLDEFKNQLEIAGQYIGLGDCRPEGGNGFYGRFELEKFKVLN